METRFLNMPKDRLSFVSFLTEVVPNWYDYESVLFGESTYTKMLNADFINRCTDSATECYTDGITTPPMIYQVKKVKFDLWKIVWVEINGKRHEFSKKTFGRKTIYISS